MEYKELPLGISSYKDARQQNCYLVDKTEYIHKLEKSGNFLFFLRPRRFGKSLFLSMLSCYYDINERDNFNEFFGDTWIAKESKLHPEKNLLKHQGKYQVLMLDFSQVGGTASELKAEFNTYCCSQINDFMDTYESYYPEFHYREIRECTDFADKLTKLSGCARRLGYPLYLIIDEYDNFTNNVLSTEGHEVYHAMTHASGFYREVFKKFKPKFTKIIMMGVSPVTLDDLTSGYNIAKNVTRLKKNNGMLGFSSEEVRDMVQYYQEQGAIEADVDTDAMMTEMRMWYDGYCFNEKLVDTAPDIFNSSMVLRYVSSFIDEGEAPQSLIDPNTKTDYNKLYQLVKLDRISGDRKSIILEIANNGFTTGNIEDSFPAIELMEESNFKSLLFYFGMVTITGMMGLTPILGIPNNNVREQFFDFLKKEYEKIRPIDSSEMKEVYMRAAIDGDWKSMLTFLCKAYKENSSIRSLIEGERNLQGFMNAYLSLNPYYQTMPEVELNHGYCDFFLMPNKSDFNNTRHSYILELKYLSASAYTEEKAQVQWNEAVEQIHAYSQGRQVQILSADTQLHSIVVQIKGLDLVRMEEV